MIPIKTDDCNFAFFVNPGSGKGQMPCLKEEDSVTSFWLCEHDDDLSLDGIYVFYAHGFQAPTSLGLLPREERFDPASLTEFPLVFAHGCYQTNMQLTDEVREFLLEGGRFVLRTGRIPPPPVTVCPA